MPLFVMDISRGIRFPSVHGQVVLQTGGGRFNPEPAELELRGIQAQVRQNENLRVSLVKTIGFPCGETKPDETFVCTTFGVPTITFRIGEAIGIALIAFDTTPSPSNVSTGP